MLSGGGGVGGGGGVRADGFGEPSLPRSNGSPVFDAPWQARAMAMAVLVVEAGGRPWDDFRSKLVEAIGEDADRPYWSSWVVALDRLVKDLGLLLPDP